MRGGRITVFKYIKGSCKKKGNVLLSLSTLRMEREVMAYKAAEDKQKRLEVKVQPSSGKDSQAMRQTA